ncbi:MAG: arginase family protein [Candidatus Methylumidiphilus sp.]
MRKCLSPFFIGRQESGLDINTGSFDLTLSNSLLSGKEYGTYSAINSINSAISEFVADTISLGKKPLVLAGDCLSAIGVLSGAMKCGIRPHLLWIDAHGDFHTHETTTSGHLGGMPLAMISGRGDLSLLNGVHVDPLADEHIYFVGGSDLESGEKEALKSSGIRQSTLITEMLDRLPTVSPLWIHFDTDYITSNDAPSMRYPSKNGVTAQETKIGFDAIARKINILGLSISAWAPHLDSNGKTAEMCWEVVSSLTEI